MSETCKHGKLICSECHFYDATDEASVASNELLAVTVDELRIICDATVRLTEIRQRGCPHLCVENAAAEIMRKLLLELRMHKQGYVRAEDLGALQVGDYAG